VCPLNHQAYLWTLGSIRDYEKNIKNIGRKSSRYILHMRGGAFVQWIVMEVCSFVKVANIINGASFGAHI
jgi:hypothetical protein